MVEYSIDNGLNWMFVDPNNTGNADTYGWVVSPVFSDEGLVRVSDKDYPAISDSSDNVFRINTLDLLSPNGKESILAGSAYDIKWRYSPTIASHQVKIEYSFNNGDAWVEIAMTDNDGHHEWQVPNIELNQYLIRITDVEDARGFDQSRDTFKVYTCREAIPGDINNDCIVDLFDFCTLSNNWLLQGYIEFYQDSLDTNSLWQTQGEWAYGEPQGLGGTDHGYPDPNSGYTGANVYGVNLNGDYSTDIGGPHHLTAGPFYCKHYSNIILKFARWLNIDGSGFAEAQVQVSNDNATWTTLWSNSGIPITDNSWQNVEYDISNIADGQEAVYIRWSYKVLDHAHAYSGWNIDDFVLSGNPK